MRLPRRTRLALLALVLPLGAASACVLTSGMREEAGVLVAPSANRGVEAYSAWFADSDGRIVYFGLSPFWQLWWQTGGDPRADLAEPGDHLIGRFDLAQRRFLEPLRVRAMADDVRSSVWDVLVHSGGRVWYTTYFEEIGSVDPRTGEVRTFDGLGRGFNELAEGPDGNVYVSRYSDVPEDVERQTHGGLVVLSPDGALLRETRFPRALDGSFTAPKSVAVHPRTGEAWLNADVFHPDGSISFAALHVAPDGNLLERRDGAPELLFVRYDPSGRGWFVEDQGQTLTLSIRDGEDVIAWLDLGPRQPLDFAQDIHFAADGTATVSFWSGQVVVVARQGRGEADDTPDAPDAAGAWRWTRVTLPRPEACRPPASHSVFYSAFAYGGEVWGTLDCGAAISHTPLPR